MDLVSNKIVTIIKSALKNVYNLENIDSLVMVEIPKLKDHGDFSSNIALRLAKVLKNSPINIANSLKGELENNDFIEKVEVVVPGFLNFFVKKDSLSEIINKIIDQGKDYGRNNFGKNEKVMVEYVSANPTGDLHLGHARGAAYGDSLTRVLKFSGYDCLREYYVNDAGNQIEVLGESLYQRYLEALGYDFDIEKIGYQGKDVKNIASKITPNNNKWFMLQMNRVHDDVKQCIDNNGDVVKTIYEKYLMTFNKPKKRSFIISKEFQSKINLIIEKIQTIKESLKLHTKLHMKYITTYINESQDKYFSEQEKSKILKDIWDKDGEFYKMLKQLDIETSNQGICQYFDDLLDDDRMLAEFATCISNIIGRSNFSVEQVRKFVQSEDLKG